MTRIYLRKLKISDASLQYVSWLNDPAVNQYLESRYTTYTIPQIKKYISSMNRKNSRSYLFGIFTNDTIHIGNIKIGDITLPHRFAHVGLLIGNKDYWGKGYATEAIRLITDYAFKNLKLHKLYAGIYDLNRASYKAFIKAGYSEIGKFKMHRLFKNTYVDEIIVEKLKE